MILITRPLDDAKKMAAMLEAKGHQCLIAPLLEIEYKNYKAPKYDYYITTSKHAKKYVPKNAKLISIPKQGQTARELLHHITINHQPSTINYLYLRGKEISFDLTIKLHQYGYDCDEVIVYEAKPVGDFDVDLSKVTLATFMSAQTLQTFIKLSDERDLAILVLSKKIATLAKKNGFKNIQIAPQPNLQSLLSVISHDPPSSRT